ncbi:MAG: PD-(D/E)XK nuclease family protein [Erysipelotrichales bacterium]|nr:PD-(D/E)XK nuclease family protein [Erysipelotrichales bacterium]
MRIDIKDDRFILVAPRKYYRDVITYFQSNNLVNFKFYTKEETLSNFYGAYDINAIIFTMNKFDVSYSNAKLLLENIYIDKKLINNKTSQLLELKDNLNALGLLNKNIYFPIELNSKPIYVLGYGNSDKELNQIFDELNIKANYINFEKGTNIPSVLEFKTIDEEIFCFFNELCDLINKGVKQSDIVLIADSQKYAFAINKMCRQFDLPKLITTTSSYLSLPQVLSIMKQIEVTGINDFLYHNEFSDDENINIVKDIIIKNKILEINKSDKQLDALKTILKNMSIQDEKVAFIKHQDNLGLMFRDKYYFILGFNQGTYPVINKDDDYLMNKEKEILGISTSFDKNYVNKNEIIDLLTNVKKVYISYPLSNSGEKLYPSSLINELNMGVRRIKSSNIYSIAEGKKILAKLEDLKRKFDIDSSERHSYGKLFQIPYMSYDHSFTKLDNYLGKEFRNYSYSNIKTFFQCQFRYYLLNVLKLNEYEETFAQKLGLLFHDVLTHVYDEDFDFEKKYLESFEKFSFDAKEKVILIRKREDLKALCSVLLEQKTSMNFKEVYFEEKFATKLSNDVMINGTIDKILITSDGVSDYYAIIDYKTGSETFNKKEVPFGFSMQLPTYALLLSENDKFKEMEMLGFYIQKVVMNKIGIPEDNASFYRDSFKLMGESTNDIEKMKTFDSTCASSLYIKSYGITKNGDFNRNAKVNSKEDFENLIRITKENYLKADDEIQKGNFIINPKIVGNEQNSQCKFCEFSDICNVKDQDYVFIELKGEEDNGMD